MTELNAPPAPVQESPKPRRIGCALAALIAVVGIGAFSLPFLNILIGILIPPGPPLPPVPLTEISRENYDYGVDEWTYRTTAEPCSLVTFYQNLGAVCSVTPMQCEGFGDGPGVATTGQPLVARCEGSEAFSLFGLSWQAVIFRDEAEPAHGRLNVWRGINWLSSANVPQ
ncbi:MAG: hypothetical protein SF162_05475 [bacterium]|nr:hypothetical protein [bacterium]